MADITTKYKSKWTGKEIDEGIEKAKNAVPLDGSKAMTGALKLQNSGATGGSYLQDAGADNLTIIVRNDALNANVARYLQLFNSAGQSDIKEALRLRDRTSAGYTNYTILHTGNKPSGSYTGNGSATSRTVDTKGVGDALLIYNSYNVGIITKYTSFVIATQGTNAGTIKTFKNPDLYFANGVLSCATDDTWVNGNGTVYNYQVL